MGHREDRAVEGVEGLLQRLGRDEVEVVGRLVEEQQGRARQLEQEDLEARLLTAGQGLEALLTRTGQAVAVQRPGRLSRGRPGRWSSPRWRISSSVRPCRPACSWVWANHPAAPAPSRTVPVCRNRLREDIPDRLVLDVRIGAAAGEQPQEVRLARAVRPQHRDPVAVPDLEVEGAHEVGQLTLLSDDGPLGGPTTGEPHPQPLRHRHLLGRTGVLEAAQPGLRGLVARRHVGL